MSLGTQGACFLLARPQNEAAVTTVHDDIGRPTVLEERVEDPRSTALVPSRPLVPAAPLPPARALAVKHAADRIIAGTLLLILLPILLVLCVTVKLTSPGPVLFRQRRIGRDGRAFDILKFRSMRVPVAFDGFSPSSGRAPGGVEGVDRRTTIGKVMRRASLDELPQLLNVVKGDMSLVGPRPERPEFVQLFADQVPGYAQRHRVHVGITGLAQVRGLRGQTSIAMRAEADNEYIERWSLLLDVKVLALTVRAVAVSGE
jgi:lipopolysaccharide/colanic/teichoic acid biosynthesis glycosyltransferase